MEANFLKSHHPLSSNLPWKTWEVLTYLNGGSDFEALHGGDMTSMEVDFVIHGSFHPRFGLSLPWRLLTSEVTSVEVSD